MRIHNKGKVINLYQISRQSLPNNDSGIHYSPNYQPKLQLLYL